MPELRIEMAPAAIFFNHLYLVYRDDDGSEYVISGGHTLNLFDFFSEINVPIGDSNDARGDASPEDRKALFFCRVSLRT